MEQKYDFLQIKDVEKTINSIGNFVNKEISKTFQKKYLISIFLIF
mgnify:CR=1 FL=1